MVVTPKQVEEAMLDDRKHLTEKVYTSIDSQLLQNRLVVPLRLFDSDMVLNKADVGAIRKTYRRNGWTVKLTTVRRHWFFKELALVFTKET